MKTTISKNGRIPLKNKGAAASEMRIGGPGPFEVPSNVKSELKQKGLKERWIDIAQLKAKGGYHKSGWTPIQFDCLKNQAKTNPFLDASMDGFLIRNGMVLAVNTQENVAQQKNYKKHRTQIQTGGSEATKAFKDLIRNTAGAKLDEDDDSSDE